MKLRGMAQTLRAVTTLVNPVVRHADYCISAAPVYPWLLNIRCDFGGLPQVIDQNRFDLVRAGAFRSQNRFMLQIQRATKARSIT
jgi:hypothetical protein